MKLSRPSRWLLILSGALLLQWTSAQADESPAHSPMQHPGMMHAPRDASEHIQKGLSHLKVALHLNDSQMASWETWSQGVLADVKANQEQMKAHWKNSPASEEQQPQTSPDRLAKQISQEEQHLAGFQQRLARQKEALVRTQTFYNTLDEKQKSIFDLFEQKMAHERHGFGHGPEHCGTGHHPHP
jgi:nitrate/nitrite-specific signal transduction histidine kinase